MGTAASVCQLSDSGFLLRRQDPMAYSHRLSVAPFLSQTDARDRDRIISVQLQWCKAGGPNRNTLETSGPVHRSGRDSPPQNS